MRMAAMVKKVLLNLTTNGALRQLVLFVPSTSARLPNCCFTLYCSNDGSLLRKRYMHCFSSPIIKLSLPDERLLLNNGLKFCHCNADVS